MATLLHLVTLYGDGGADGKLLGLALHGIAVKATLHEGVHIQEAFLAIAVHHTDADVIILLGLQDDVLLRAYVEGVFTTVLGERFVDGLLVDIHEPVALLLVDIDAHLALLEGTAGDLHQDIADDVRLATGEGNATLRTQIGAMARGAHEAGGWKAFTHDGLRLVFLANDHLGQLHYPFFQHNGERLALGILLIGNIGGKIRHMTEREFALTAIGDGEFEVALGIGDDAYRVVLEADADVFDGFASLVDHITLYHHLSHTSRLYHNSQQ